MSNLNYQELALLNSVSEQCRTLTARMDAQVQTMEAFRTEAMRLLLEMSQAHKPKENNDRN